MSRIGSTISGLERYFLTHLNRLDESTIDSAIRLSTGKRISRPSDDPAGFIQLTGMEQRWNVIQQTKTQVDAAASVGAETQLTLDEARTQLDTIRSALLLDEEGLLTSDEQNRDRFPFVGTLIAI
jgi:flagellin-like hook-associated protein FlgL